MIYLDQWSLGHDFESKIFDLFALHTWQSQLFKPWQFFTYMFLHASIDHIFFNMFALWTFGSVLENLWGPKRFILFYLICGLGAAFCHMSVLYYENQKIIHALTGININADNASALVSDFITKYGSNLTTSNGGPIPITLSSAQEVLNANLDVPTLGASGAIFGCLAAFGYLFPNTSLYLMFIPIPIKAKWLVIGYILLELYSTVQSSAGDSVAHVAHLGGALFGLILVYYWNKNKRNNFY